MEWLKIIALLKRERMLDRQGFAGSRGEEEGGVHRVGWAEWRSAAQGMAWSLKAVTKQRRDRVKEGRAEFEARREDVCVGEHKISKIRSMQLRERKGREGKGEEA